MNFDGIDLYQDVAGMQTRAVRAAAGCDTVRHDLGNSRSYPVHPENTVVR